MLPILQKKWRKCGQYLWKCLGISSEKVLPNQFLGTIPKIFSRVSQEFLETGSQNCDLKKIFHLGDQFWGISREFPRDQLQEMIPEKFLRNSSKKVTTVGEFLTFVTWVKYIYGNVPVLVLATLQIPL